MTIEEILAQSKTILHKDGEEQKAGGAFSKVTFDDEDAERQKEVEVEINDADFWKKTIGEQKFKELTADEELQKRNKVKKKYTQMSERQFLKRLREVDREEENVASADIMEARLLERSSNGSSGRKVSVNDMGAKDFSGEASDDEGDDEGSATNLASQSVKVPKLCDEPLTKKFCEAAFRAISTCGYGKLDQARAQNAALSNASSNDIKYAVQSLILLNFHEAIEDTALESFDLDVEIAKENYEADMQTYSKAMNERAARIAKGAGYSRPPEAPKPKIPTFEGVRSKVCEELWIQHKFWLIPIVVDALSLEKTEAGSTRKKVLGTKPHLATTTDVHNKALEGFYISLWPQLQSRGWRNDAAIGVEAYPPKGNPMSKVLHSTVRQVLDTAKSLHQELSKIVDEILATDEEEAGKAHRESTAVIRDNGDANLEILEDPKKVYTILIELISWFCPSTMQGDERYRSFLRRNKNRLTKFQYIEALRFPLKAANLGSEGEMRIPYTKAGSPDSLNWKVAHDEVIVRAFEKYGWIEGANAYDEVLKDSSLGFPPPFGTVGDDKLFGFDDAGKKNASLWLKGTRTRAQDVVNKLEGGVGGKMTDTSLLSKLASLFGLESANEGWRVKEDVTGIGWDLGLGVDEIELPDHKQFAYRSRCVAKEILKAIQAGYYSSSGSSATFLDRDNFNCRLLVLLIKGATASFLEVQDFVRIVKVAKEEFEMLLAVLSETARARFRGLGAKFDYILSMAEERGVSIECMNELREIVGLRPVDSQGESAIFVPLKGCVVMDVGDRVVGRGVSGGIELNEAETLVLSEILDQGLPVLGGVEEGKVFNFTWKQLRENVLRSGEGESLGKEALEELKRFCGEEGEELEFAKRALELVEEVRQTAGVIESVKLQSAATEILDEGLGSGVMDHGKRMLAQWGER
jgi:hypothetical protein